MMHYIIGIVLFHPLLLLIISKPLMFQYVISIFFPVINIILGVIIITLVLSQRGEEGAFTKIISAQNTKTDSSAMMKQTILFGSIFLLLFLPINQMIYLNKKLLFFTV